MVGKHVGDVGFHLHPREVGGSGGARRGALHPHEPIEELGVVAVSQADLSAEVLHPRALAPVVAHLANPCLAVCFVRIDRGIGREQHERVAALGVGGGEQRARVPAFRDSEQGDVIDTRRVEHGVDVVHARLERDTPWAVGQPGPTGVEHDEPGLGGDEVEQSPGVRLAPQTVDRAEVGRVQHRVRPLARHLVSDRHATRSRVLDIRNHEARMMARRPIGASGRPNVSD